MPATDPDAVAAGKMVHVADAAGALAGHDDVRARKADDGADSVPGPAEVGGRLDGDRVAGFQGGDLLGG